MAIYWLVRGNANGSTQVSWRIQGAAGQDIATQCALLNDEASRRATPDAHGVIIDPRSAEGAADFSKLESGKEPIIAKPPDWHMPTLIIHGHDELVH
jgi:hypothetical protein